MHILRPNSLGSKRISQVAAVAGITNHDPWPAEIAPMRMVVEAHISVVGLMGENFILRLPGKSKLDLSRLSG